ncbi:hypothetical protein [Methylomagnum sp.]
MRPSHFHRRRSKLADHVFLLLFVAPMSLSLAGMMLDMMGLWDMQGTLSRLLASPTVSASQQSHEVEQSRSAKPQTRQPHLTAYTSRLSLAPAPSQYRDSGSKDPLSPGSFIHWSEGAPTGGSGAFSVVGPEPGTRSSIARWRNHLDSEFASVQAREDGCRWWRDYFYLYESNHGMLTLKENLERYCR